MAKVTLNDIQSGYLTTSTYNANNAAIEAAFEKTLSRDGSTPNQLEADIDLNSYSLLNGGTLDFTSLSVETLTLNGDIVVPTDLAVSALPDQTTHTGKFLTTDGTNASWGNPLSTSMVYTHGGTGTVATTVAAKLQETVSIKDFGAVAGGTDNAAYFAAAAAYCAANPVNLHIPPGDWYSSVSLALVLTASGVGARSFAITGDGADVSRLVFTAATDGIDVTFTDWFDGTCEIKDLGVHTSYVGAAGTAIKIQASAFVSSGTQKGPTVDNVRIGASFVSNANDTYWTNGVYFKHMPHASVENSWINGNPDNTLGIGIQFDTWTITPHISNTNLYNWNKGVYINGYQTEGIHIVDSWVISCYDGLYVDTYADGIAHGASGTETALTVSNTAFDVDHWGVYLKARENIIIDSCDFYGQETNTPGHADIYAASAVANMIVSNNYFRRDVGSELSTGIDLVDCATSVISGNWIRSRDTAIRVGGLSTRPTIYGNDLDGCAVEIEDNTLTLNKDLRVVAHKKAMCSAHTLLNMSSVPSIGTGTTPVVVTGWTANQEHGGGDFSVTKLTIPTGVAKVLLRANICFAANATGYRRASIYKNGVVYVGCADVEVSAAPTGVTSINLSSAPTTVVAGDYFEVFVSQTSGGNLDLTAASRTWFSMEVLA